MIILKLERLYGEYTNQLSIFPNEMELALREEGKTSENLLVDRIEYYLQLHHMNVIFPKEEVRQTIISNQTDYNNYVVNHSRKITAQNLHSMKKHIKEQTSVQERMNLLVDLLKRMYQTIDYNDNANEKLDYNAHLADDIINIFKRENHDNIDSCLREVEQMICEFVEENSRKCNENVKSHLRENYMLPLNKVYEQLAQVLNQETVVPAVVK